MEDFSHYNAEGTQLRRAQNKMLDILKIVSEICDKNGIPYWLEGGTLLGAVRHKGFIPWDDDLDICVLRKDMHRLKKCLIKELPSDYEFLDRFTKWNYARLYAKVCDKKSNVVEPDRNGIEYGVFIDIFPVERVLSQRTKKIVDAMYRIPIKGMRGCYGKSFVIKSVFMLMYIPMTIPVLISRLLVRILGSKNYALPYGKKAYNTIPSKFIFPLKKIEFEGLLFSAPDNPDKYLRRLFGDYMVIPPEEKRLVHTSSITFFD